MGFLQRNLLVRLLSYFLLLSILPLGSVAYIAYYFTHQTIDNHVEEHLDSVATLKEREIEGWVKHLEEYLVWIATKPQIQSHASTLLTYATVTPQYLPAYEYLVTEFRRAVALGEVSLVLLLHSTSGQVVVSSDPTWEGRFRESEPYFVEGKNSTYVSGIFYSLSLDRPTMVISTPVMDSTGQLSGVLVAHANLEWLNNVMAERTGLGETGETYLVNKNNLLLTESRFIPEATLRQWVFTEGVSRAFKGEHSVSLYTDYRGVPIIGSYRWLEEMKVVLLAEIDEAEAFAPIHRLRNLFIVVTAIATVIVAVVCVLVARRITDPLARLADYAGRVGKGEYAAELEIKGRDEVASVSSTIKTMVEQMLEIQENLVASERLATLGHVTGSIAHELRNPLGVIDSSAYYLKRKLKDGDKKVQVHLDRIRSSVGISTTIIESLLSLTRMKELQLEKLDLIAITTDAIATSKVPAKVNVIKNFPEPEVLVSADREQLGVVFQNIIKNAVEAMDGRGTLTLTVRRTADSQAEVSFVDTGPGIAPENLHRVFQPLFTTKAKGIGFGLSIARMIIDRHGGALGARSEPGKGATIILRLPLCVEINKEV